MSDSAEWRDYLAAARRKIRVCEYHIAQLEHCPRDTDAGGQPSIDVQAHFEGILYGLVAAADQTAEAINQAFGLGLDKPTLQHSLERMPQLGVRSRLFRWQQAGIAVDVRNIRRRATHHYYEKLLFKVQPPVDARPYSGSRELWDYARAAVDHATKLAELLDALESSIP